VKPIDKWCAVFSVCVMALGLSTTALASERSGGHFTLSSSQLESATYNAKGRILTRTTEYFAKGGELQRTAFETFAYSGRYLVETTRKTVDTEGALVGRRVTNWTRARRHVATKRVRKWYDANDELTRREVAVWDTDREKGSTLITATSYDGAGTFIEVRYTLQYRNRGKHYSTDVSVFDAEGWQTFRQLSVYKDLRIDRWTFDKTDETLTHSVEKLRKNKAGQRVHSEMENFKHHDRKDVFVGSRVQEYLRVGPKGSIKRLRTTWYDAEGLGLNRRTITSAYDSNGGLADRRTLWETWAKPTPSNSTR
jgi:hypothetical protein